MLRPTPGDPWGVEQHHWNTGAEENQQLNPDGPSNLTIDVPQLAEKVVSDFIDLISKRYDTKKKYSNLSKVVFKTLTDLSGLEYKKRSKKFKNIIKGGCIPNLYNDQKNLSLWN